MTYYLLRAPTLARFQAELAVEQFGLLAKQVMLEQREAVLALLKSDELAAVVRIGQARKAKASSMPSSCAELCSSCSGWWPTSPSAC
jgi:hypothetical protein